MKIYLSGKITGDANYRQKFGSMEKELLSYGYVVFNPAILLDGFEYEDYMDLDLLILSRCDDVIVLMNGYNVYAPPIQDQVNSSEYINQTVVVGHGKPYLSALISLNQQAYEKWCTDNKVQPVSPNENTKFKTFLLDEINNLISQKEHYHYYEKIKNVYFVKEEFSESNGCLTNTLKVKYRKVCDLYESVIENLYK